MSEQTRAIHPIYDLLPTEIEGFDALMICCKPSDYRKKDRGSDEPTVKSHAIS